MIWKSKEEWWNDNDNEEMKVIMKKNEGEEIVMKEK